MLSSTTCLQWQGDSNIRNIWSIGGQPKAQKNSKRLFGSVKCPETNAPLLYGRQGADRSFVCCVHAPNCKSFLKIDPCTAPAPSQVVRNRHKGEHKYGRTVAMAYSCIPVLGQYDRPGTMFQICWHQHHDSWSDLARSIRAIFLQKRQRNS